MRVIDQGFVFDARRAPPNRRFCTFINVCVLSDERILVMFRAGSSKDAADENLLLLSSSDKGKTWTTLFEGLDPVLDGVPGSWRCGCVTELAPGHLIGIFDWFDRSDPKRPFCNPVTEGILHSRIFVLESRDDGRRWTDRREIDPAPFEAMALTGPILKLANGSLAAHYECWKSYDNPAPGKHHALLRVFNNGRLGFGPNIVTAHDPKERLFFYDQRLAVDPRTGQLIGCFWTYDRSSGQDVNVHVAWGSPDGTAWTLPVDTGIAGQITNPLPLPDGKLLSTYVHRDDPPSLRAVLNHDLGKTWDVRDEVSFYQSAGREPGVGVARATDEFWQDMARWSFGHPEGRALRDGTIFIAFYGGNSDAMGVRWVRLDLTRK